MLQSSPKMPGKALDVRRPKLRDELKPRLKSWADGELKTAARKLKIRYQALRQDLSQNRFHEAELIRLCEAAGLPKTIGTLRNRFDFELKQSSRGVRKSERSLQDKIQHKTATLADVFADLDERMKHVDQFVDSARDIIPKFFGSLSSDDTLVIFISDDLPTHWDRSEAANWIGPFAEKLKSGARVLYVHPSNDLVAQITNAGYPGMFSEEQVRTRFKMFERDLTGAWTGQRKVSEQLCLIPHNCPIVTTPQHRYVLYFSHVNNKSMIRATGTFPIRQPRGVGDTFGDYLVVPLNQTFSSILQDACVTALHERAETATGQQEKNTLAAFLKAVSPH